MSATEESNADDLPSDGQPEAASSDSGPRDYAIGRIEGTLPNRQLRVTLGRDDEVVASLSGASRIGIVRLLRGDLVRVERSPFDSRRARIIGRASADEADRHLRADRPSPDDSDSSSS